MGEFDPACVLFEVLDVEGQARSKVIAERGNGGGGEDRSAISVSLAGADGEDAGLKVDVLDAKAESFEEAEAGAVEERGHIAGSAFELEEEATHFAAGEDDGHAAADGGADEIVEPGEVLTHHVTEQEE